MLPAGRFQAVVPQLLILKRVRTFVARPKLLFVEMVLTKFGRVLPVFLQHFDQAFVIFLCGDALGNAPSLIDIPALCRILLEAAGHLVVELFLVKEGELVHWEKLW